jgi:hypothetical protein
MPDSKWAKMTTPAQAATAAKRLTAGSTAMARSAPDQQATRIEGVDLKSASKEEQAALDVERIRLDFPILQRTVHDKPLIYLDNAATSQKPLAVIDALVEYYREHNANVHRTIHTLGDEATTRYEEAREKTRRFINAPTAQSIIFLRNATEAINLVAYAWLAKRGRWIVLSVMGTTAASLADAGAARASRFTRHRRRACCAGMMCSAHRREDQACGADAYVERSRNHQPDSGDQRDRSRLRSAHARRRRPERPPHARRRAGPGLRLPRLLKPQDAGPDGRRRTLRATRRPGEHGAVSRRRAHDLARRAPRSDVQCRALAVGGGHP